MRPAVRPLLAALLGALLLLAPLERPQAAPAVTEEEIQAGLHAMQLLLAGPVTDSEEKRIRAEIAGRSRSEPEVIKQEMTELASLVQAMRQLPGGAEMSALRQLLLATIFQQAMQERRYFYRAAVQVLYERLGPVAWNESDGTFFSVADAQVLVWLTGGDPADRDQVEAVVLQVNIFYADIPYEQRLLLGSLHFAYALGVFADYVPPAPQTVGGQPANGGESGGGESGGGETGGIEPWALEIMSEVMTDMHITTLNIIENMGDTGDYWEWEPAW